MKNLILAISHNIYLTEEQEKFILDKTPIETIGVCVPVWHYSGKSSEPAKEIFCKYFIYNEKNDFPVEKFKSGFKINIPQIPEGYKKDRPLTDEEWRGMSEKDLSEWYERNTTPVNAEYLKDKGCLYYIQYDKFMFKTKLVDIVHSINIKPEEVLINSLT